MAANGHFGFGWSAASRSPFDPRSRGDRLGTVTGLASGGFVSGGSNGERIGGPKSLDFGTEAEHIEESMAAGVMSSKADHVLEPVNA